MQTNNERLLEWAKRRGITDAQLAVMLGIDRTYMSRIRTGQRQVHEGMAWRFAQSVGYELADELLRFERQPA